MAGSTNYPGALDAHVDKVDGVDTVHADDVNNVSARTVALETVLGTNPQGSAASVKARIAAVEAAVGGGGAVSSVVGATGAVTGTQILADSAVAAALAAKLGTTTASATYAPIAHGHAQSDVTGLVAALGAKADAAAVTSALAAKADTASLGNAAARNVGTTTGTVAAGDDSRLTSLGVFLNANYR